MAHTLPRRFGQFDQAACWAACLEWWLRYMNYNRHGHFTIRNQMSIMSHFSGEWNADDTSSGYGTIPPAALRRVVRSDWFQMEDESRTGLDAAFISGKLQRSPVVVGYQKPGVGPHINIIFEYNPGNHRVRSFDPAYGSHQDRYGTDQFDGGYHLVGLNYFQPVTIDGTTGIFTAWWRR
ncbi:hypothetical protein [Larkinella soli]|uniref:hypothetical protein n=1 Tax=Larkinella soli TaxID=1770527 RepID=UPI000FFC2404|nr:hypothetical protein [Larkinella soli]